MSHQDVPEHTIPSRMFMGLAIGAVLVAMLAACFTHMPGSNHNASPTSSTPVAQARPRHPDWNTEPAFRYVVPAGSNVWTMVSNHVSKYNPWLTPAEHEHQVFELVRSLQESLDVQGQQPVRNLNNVPIGFTFYASASGIIGL